MLALTSSSSAAAAVMIKARTYDVFLSFRGPDTRDGFVSHLYKDLCRKNIETFIDNEELPIGDEISGALLTAIEGSRVSVIVFSKGYASSKWCLAELVKIMECNKRVVPVFYGVKPRDVRNQTGSFADAFAMHEENFRHEPEKVETWRSALTLAGKLSGWDSQVTRPESTLVDEIVEDIVKKLNCGTSSANLKGLVGIDRRMQKVLSLFEDGFPDFRMLGIWGMGGIGKTTLADAIYHHVSNGFQSCCFLANVREHEERGELFKLRNEFLSTISEDAKLNISTPTIGSGFLKGRLSKKKVLIVFDDVSKLRQLEILFGGIDQFGPGSRVIVTTRNKQVLVQRGIDRIYEVEELDGDESDQLFRQSAFKSSHPTKYQLELSKMVSSVANGNPLAITLIGSSLSGKTKSDQETEVKKLKQKKLKQVPNQVIQNVLKWSLDGLDWEEKEMFLDIACFFKGEDRDHVTSVMDACYVSAHSGIENLIDKSLISVSENKIAMHDLLQQMGWNIVREESPLNPEERSRLWIPRDNYDVLVKNKGSKTLTGIVLDMFKHPKLELEPKALMKMRKLRFLKFYRSCGRILLPKGLLSFPEKLRYLYWEGYPLRSLPTKFDLRYLVELDMRESHLEQLWEGKQDLVNLKVITLTDSRNLVRIPDLSSATNLEKITLSRCSNLRELHSSLQHLKNLTDLVFRGCKNLTSLPSFYKATSLTELDLSYCSNLFSFPKVSPSVTELYLQGMAIEELPSSIECLSNLRVFNIKDCRRLKSIPIWIHKLESLEGFFLNNCSRLETFPEILDTMERLSDLDLSGTALKELPSSIGNLIGLKKLRLNNCENLICLSDSFYKLKSLAVLDLQGCSRLEIFPEIKDTMKCLFRLDLSGTALKELPSSIDNLIGLYCLSLNNCENLVCLPDSFYKLKSLLELDLEGCSRLEIFPEIKDTMDRLFDLDLSKTALKELPSSIDNLIVLKELRLNNCENLICLPDSFYKLKSLAELDLQGCSRLEIFPEIKDTMEYLYELNLSGTALKELPSSIDNLIVLKELRLNNCENLICLPDSFYKLKSLAELDLQGCSRLEIFPEIKDTMECVRKLDLSRTALKELPSSIDNLIVLKKLRLNNCENFICLPDSFYKLKSLAELDLQGCSRLEIFPEIKDTMEYLYELNLSGTALKELPSSIDNLIALNSLILNNCEKLIFLPDSFYKLKYLESLELCGRSNLVLRNFLTSIGGRPVKQKYLRGLPWLWRLNLSESNLENLPTTIKQFRCLELILRKCKRLKSLPELPPSLTCLDAHDCTSLEDVSSIKKLFEQALFCQDKPYRRLDLKFSNCFKLGEKGVGNDIDADDSTSVEEVSSIKKLLKQEVFCKSLDQKAVSSPETPKLEMPFEQMVTVLKDYHQAPPESKKGTLIVTCVPGSEIPEWFHFKSSGSSINIPLPSEWWINIPYIVASIVVSFPDYCDSYEVTVGHISCQYVLKSCNGDSEDLGGYFYIEFEEGLSDHMFLFYDDFRVLEFVESEASNKHFYNQASFDFRIDGWRRSQHKPSQYKVKQCGVHLSFAN